MSALKKCIDRKGQLIEQTGENHPDVIVLFYLVSWRLAVFWDYL